MRRRDFLIVGGATLGALTARPSLAQGKRSAAVVVGVDRPDGLTPLGGAASGAKDVADWLSGEHFEVTLLTDQRSPNAPPKQVHAEDVARAVRTFVDRGVYDQFVLYFAGHGLLQNYDEIWVLSGAPVDAGDAIAFNGSSTLAQLSSIPNVIIISDCCRTIPSGPPLALVSGRPAFPATGHVPAKPVKIDHFCATTIGAAAYEVSLDKRVADYKGIFTSANLSAFQSPEDTFVTVVDGEEVITDSNLAMYLDAEVPRRARAANIAQGQYPQSTVGPDPNNYLAKVHGPTRHAANAPPPPPTLNALASASLAQLGGHLAGPVPLTPALENLSAEVELRKHRRQNILVRVRGAELLFGQVRSGFSVWGRRVISVITQAGVGSTIVNAATSGVSIQFDHAHATTVGLVFDDGCGCVLPALAGFLACVTVDDQGISDVTYSSTGVRSPPQLENYRATVATAAKYGVFQIRDRATAEQVARTIRQGKMYDCTLGIYAAYAYAQAGMIDGVRSVNEALQGEYGATFFDVAMLADKLRDIPNARERTLVPFCPMLAQGWSLLQAKRVTLPDALRAVQHYTKLALWTTFNPTGMRMVVEYMRSTAAKVT